MAYPLLAVAIPMSVLHACRFCAQQRQLPDQYRAVRDEIQMSGARCDVVSLMGGFQCLGIGVKLWSMNESPHAMWPDNLRPLVRMMHVNGGWSVCQRPSMEFVVCVTDTTG